MFINFFNRDSRQICIIRHGYFPEDPRVFKEVQALKEAGYHVHVLCLRKKNEKLWEKSERIRIYRFPHKHVRGSKFRYIFEYTTSFLLFGFFISVLRVIRRFDVVQVNTLPDALIFTTFIPRLLGSRIILDMHEPSPELWITKYGTSKTILYQLQTIFEQRAIKFAHSVITVNETIRNRFIQRGADESKIHVIRNVPLTTYIHQNTTVKQNNVFTLISHGTVEKRYGQELLIRSLPLIREKIQHLNLYIIGSGEDMKRIQLLCSELNCSDIVTFTGYIPFSEVSSYITRGDIGLVPLEPSPFADLCQPNKLFEYIAHKKPVICTKLEAIKESFDDSCVMFIDPWEPQSLAQCVIKMYQNPNLMNFLAANAYERYSELNWSKSKGKYLKIINNS